MKGSAMNLKSERAELLLEAHQSLRLFDAAGTQVACVRGELWITQHRDREDHFLVAGDALTLDRNGLALIHAVEPAELALIEPAELSLESGRIAPRFTAALIAIGRWVVRRFGPEAIGDHRWRGWYGAL
jgi:Protein of unknown function (DUF2917)